MIFCAQEYSKDDGDSESRFRAHGHITTKEERKAEGFSYKTLKLASRSKGFEVPVPFFFEPSCFWVDIFFFEE